MQKLVRCQSLMNYSPRYVDLKYLTEKLHFTVYARVFTQYKIGQILKSLIHRFGLMDLA